MSIIIIWTAMHCQGWRRFTLDWNIAEIVHNTISSYCYDCTKL